MCRNCDDIQKNADKVITQTMIRHASIETALENLFQACSRLCLDDMQKLEAEINEASAALGAASPGGLEESHLMPVAGGGAVCPNCGAERELVCQKCENE